ncbi:MAG: cyanophycinase [Cytophagales bacterium]|nr:cyanophycinase [Cytophagales bacterium]MDW8383582.1 cyanophycinase [Flammeovirgaceae bacterium]
MLKNYLKKAVLATTLCYMYACTTNSPSNKELPSESSTEVSSNNKGKLFIIGGGPRPVSLIKRLVDASGIRNGGYVVILPMASADPADTVLFYSRRQFDSLGIKNIVAFSFKKGEKPAPSKIDSLSKATIIYISGGDQNKFMDIVGGTEIEKAILTAYQNGATIAGTSAGAAVMSEKMITGNALKYPDYESTFEVIEAKNLDIGRGLGFIKRGIIDQHFLIRSRHNRLITSIIEYPDLIGVGIDESTAILVQGDSAEVVGLSQVMVFENPERSAYQKNGKLGARNLRIHLLVEGEKFFLR